MAQLTPLDATSQPNRKDVLQQSCSAVANTKNISTDATAWGFAGLVVNSPTAVAVLLFKLLCTQALPMAPTHLLLLKQGEPQLKQQLKCYEEYKTAHKHIKDIWCPCCHPEAFIATLADPDVSCVNVIIDHLMTTYDMATHEDLDQNEEDIKVIWCPSDWGHVAGCSKRVSPIVPSSQWCTSLTGSDDYILRVLVQNVSNTKPLIQHWNGMTNKHRIKFTEWMLHLDPWLKVILIVAN